MAFLGSSGVEQVAVNHRVVGSNPARGVSLSFFAGCACVLMCAAILDGRFFLPVAVFLLL